MIYLIIVVRISRCKHDSTVACSDAEILVGITVNSDGRLPRQPGELIVGSARRSIAGGVEAVGIVRNAHFHNIFTIDFLLSSHSCVYYYFFFGCMIYAIVLGTRTRILFILICACKNMHVKYLSKLFS